MPRLPFRKLKGLNKATTDFAGKHDRRPVMFNITTTDGSTVEFQGSVTKADVPKLMKLLKQVQDLTNKS